MVIRHGGLTAAERVKKAVEVCKDRCSPYCPYWTEDECRTLILTDCAEAIAERDERIAIMQESMETLEKRCNALEALEQRCKTLEVLEKRDKPKESIPISWLEEMLDGHPELPYAVTDGITNVISLWRTKATWAD